MYIRNYIALIILTITGCGSAGKYNPELAKNLPKDVALNHLQFESGASFTRRCHFKLTTMAVGKQPQRPYDQYTMGVFSYGIGIYTIGYGEKRCGLQDQSEKTITALKAMGVKD